MTPFRLSIIVIIIVFSAINVQESTTDTSVSLPKSSLVEIKSNQEDGGGVHSNTLDIHLAMESGGTSLSNTRSIIRDELKSILRDYNNSILENVEEKSPITARSVVYDFEKTKFDYINTKFQTIENMLKNIQAENKKSSLKVDGEVTCLKEETLGVRHSTCPKPPKSEKSYPKNCKEILRNGNNVSGIYDILPKYAEEPFPVLCDMEIKGGGWTHFQKRFDGSQDFYLGWRDYKFGFGSLEGEFWLGLQKIYLLSGFEPTELLVEIVDRDNVSAFAHYTSFAIGAEPGGYKLDRLSGFSGDAGDSLTAHLGSKFSTKDLDFTNDACATKYLGGYWYKACHISNLNGKYINIDLPAKFNYQGLHWKTFRSHEYCHSKSRMLVRPLN
ncbi:microfibril-associated glycoprotein 4-like [Anoplophora glabripennis]|uniref:microfibril-associated glycoprotein 4-like n=1 Tax=Anoplophora glabripennis TaxID=217634 RepID=UPI000C78F967|nr:microfibril-associated glycoprotein 4-like [Anoplophora glabripennis]